MTIYIPNDGEEYLLRVILGNTGSCVLKLHLYAKSWETNDCVDVTDQSGALTKSWLVEANKLGDNSTAENGYSAQPIVGGNWNFTTSFEGLTTAEYSAPIIFTFTDNSIPGICGYWIESTTNVNSVVVYGDDAISNNLDGTYYLASTLDANSHNFYSKDGLDSYPRIGLSTYADPPNNTYWALATDSENDFNYYITDVSYPNVPDSINWQAGNLSIVGGIMTSLNSTAIMVEEFANAPITIPSYGATISVTPKVRLFGGTPTPRNPATCDFIECGGTGNSADCGLISAPSGYIWAVDCNSCECVLVVDPNSPQNTRAVFTRSCNFIECGGIGAHADCGLIAAPPGYIWAMDCNSCKCVLVVSPPPAASCNFIECGGTAAYADCGLITPPSGYIWAMDCNSCECIQVVNPNS